MSRRTNIVIVLILMVIFCGFLLNSAFAAENRGHAAPASALPKELKNTPVRDYFIPSATREAGLLQTTMAHVIVAREDLSQAYFATSGDKLYEKDIVFTLGGSKCRIKLHNEDVITLGDNSRLVIKEASGNRNSPEKKSIMALVRGKAMFYAIRLLKHRGLSMTVEGPTAIAGVRGTKFGMEITGENEKTVGVLPLMLADTSDNWAQHLLLAQASQPPGSLITTIHGFDGTVVVTSTITGRSMTVGAGQTLTTTGLGLGPRVVTPPNVAQRFQSATNVPPPPSGGEGGGGAGTGGSQESTGGQQPSTGQSSDSGVPPTADLPDTSSLTQNQNTTTQETQKIDPVTDPQTNVSGSRVGYLASMLTQVNGERLGGVFISQNRYTGDENLWARGIVSPGTDYLRAYGNGEFSISPYLKWVNIGTNSSGDLGENNPIIITELGNNAQQKWGYATMPHTVSVGENTYAMDNQSYWIFGYSTASLSGLTGTVTYKGSAYGTFWSLSRGIPMTGYFKTQVNLASGAISDFGLSVTGTGAQASISGASGLVGADAHVEVSGGTWNLNGATPDYKKAYGSLYGPEADAIGGPWAMYNSSLNTGAVGIFQGEKQTPVVDPVTDPATNASGTHVGYFTSMLTRVSGGTLGGVFISKNRYAGDGDLWARGIVSPETDYIRAYGSGSFAGNPYLKWVNIGTSGSGDLAEGNPFSSTTLGSSSYMEWGYATVPDAFSLDGNSYRSDNRTYWLFGSNTTALAGLTGTAIYSGDAYGTYWSSGGGVNMTGSFSANLNLASGAISDFGLSVTGTGAQASISGASGIVGADAHFEVSGGTWNLNGTAPDYKKAHGSLYGPEAETMGGPWAMYNSSLNTGAVGIFKGEKAIVPVVDPVTDPATNASGTHVGYQATMLTDVAGESLGGVFISKNRYADDGHLWARGIVSPETDYMRSYDSHSSLLPSLKWVKIGTGNSGDLAESNPLISTALGSSSYMDWGYAIVPNTFALDGSTYRNDNRGYWLFGYNTPSLSGLTGTATYSGNAYGTYWTAGGGVNMTGTFSTNLNLASGALSDFGLSVTGTGAQAYISGASGIVGADAHFEVSGGTWNLNGATPDYKKAHGSLYGPEAEAMGGPWAMYNSSLNTGAVGIFQGEKQLPVVDPVTDPATNASGANTGYFASMLTQVSGGTLGGVFISKNRYADDGHLWARSIVSPETDYIRAYGNGSFAGNPYLKWVNIGTSNSGDLAEGNPVSSTTLGSSSYMEWGYATVPTSFALDGNSYRNNNRTYWLFGYNTPSFSGFTGTAIYSGDAYGTYWNSGGGVNMTGSFNANLNLASGAISDFGLSVTGSGAQAYISGASGLVGADAHFEVSGGNWNLNGTIPNYKKAYGSLYGPAADAMGGAWAMFNSSLNTGAVGIFKGEKEIIETPATMGYIAGLLDNAFYNEYAGTFLSVDAGNMGNVYSASSTAPVPGVMVVEGSTGSQRIVGMTMSQLTWTGSNAMPLSPLSSNAYMEWGTWTSPSTITIGQMNYAFKNEGWYVKGNNMTTDAQMATLAQNQVIANYAGNAFGTYYTAGSTGTRLTGSFSTTVNFAAAASAPISAFNINVSGGNNTVQITGANGYFYGSTGYKSQFMIAPSSGTWTINGTTVTDTSYKGAYGAVYESTGQAIGGNWKIGTTGKYATGVFQGTK